MRLLYITNSINGSGGLERVLSIKASYFADVLGYEVIIAVLNNGADNPFYEFSNKIRFISQSVGGNPIQYIRQYRSAIQNFVRQAKADVVLVCDDGLKAFFIPKILGNLTGSIIYERHVSKLIELPLSASRFQKSIAKIKWYLMDKLASQYDAFVVLTEGNKAEWNSLNNLIVIPNPQSFSKKEVASLESKKVLCVGKVSIQKGQDILAEAWADIVAKHPDWELHNYGKLDDTVLSSDDLPDNMFLHPPEQNIEKRYLESSIYVLPSRYEGFGMVLIEAMSFGVPCVAFNCNYGPGDIVSNNEDGLLIPLFDVSKLSNAISELIDDKDLRKKFGQNALNNVKRYDVDKIVTKWEDLFKTLKN